MQVVAQIDSVLEESRSNPELAAIWLIDANRLAQLYQLRCVANLSTCEQDEKVLNQELNFILILSFFEIEIDDESTYMCPLGMLIMEACFRAMFPFEFFL